MHPGRDACGTSVPWFLASTAKCILHMRECMCVYVRIKQ